MPSNKCNVIIPVLIIILMVLTSWQPLREFTSSVDECRTDKQLPMLSSSQQSWVMSPSTGLYCLQPLSFIITEPRKLLLILAWSGFEAEQVVRPWPSNIVQCSHLQLVPRIWIQVFEYIVKCWRFWSLISLSYIPVGQWLWATRTWHASDLSQISYFVYTSVNIVITALSNELSSVKNKHTE